jgi:hypothetical protein
MNNTASTAARTCLPIRIPPEDVRMVYRFIYTK